MHEGKARLGWLAGSGWVARLAVLYYCTVVYAFLPASSDLAGIMPWPIYAASTYDVMY